jgi:lipid II:glycine glycyltransferase (peptidoglycan interpeptide bridge formation enzyme)
MSLHIRQSKQWEEYFKKIRWKGVRIKNSSVLFFFKTPFGSFGKCQRPNLLGKKDLKEIDRVCKKERALFLKIELARDQNPKIFEEFGYVDSKFPLAPPSTLIIDLTKTKDALWGDLSKSGRYGARRANREGAESVFHRNPTNEQMETYYELQKSRSQKKKFYIAPLNDLLSRRDIFKENSFLGFVYDSEGSLAGGKFFLGYEDQALFLNGGMNEVGEKSRAGFDLMWESILYFKKLGFKSFDLEGVYDARYPKFTTKWIGFSRFKEKFGGEVVRFSPPKVKYFNFLFRFLSRCLSL